METTPQLPPAAPQFASPTAMQILQQLLSSYGQQSIKPQAPGSQGQAAGTPGAIGGQTPGGPAFPNAIPSALNYLTNGAGADIAQNGLSQGLGFAANPAGTYGPFQGGIGADLSNAAGAVGNGLSNAGSALMSLFA